MAMRLVKMVPEIGNRKAYLREHEVDVQSNIVRCTSLELRSRSPEQLGYVTDQMAFSK